MRSRHTSASLLFAFIIVAAAACGGGLAISACSSTTASVDPEEAGVDATMDAKKPTEAGPRPPEDDSAPPLTPQECAAKCKTDMPAAAAKYEAVDTCWAAKCQGPCVDMTGVFDAGAPDPDAGDGGDDGGDGGRDADAGPPNNGETPLCTSTYSSGTDKACDDCTEAYCCAAWDGCFNDQSCKDYNACLGDCLQ